MRQWLEKFTSLFGQALGKTKPVNTSPNDGLRQHDASGNILIYLHMAKTAGATLGDILNRQFSNNEIILPGKMDTVSALGLLPSQQVIQRFQEISPQQWSATRLVPGHFMFGIHNDIPAPSIYLTMLRHPVSRVVSSYYYILEQPGIPVRENIISRKLDLASYVESGLGLDPHNYQTRVLAGLPEYDATWENTKKVLSRGLPDSALDLAKRNMERHIPFTGITERFDEFLLLLKLTFGWPLERILYRRVNETLNKPSIKDIPERTIQLIEAHNSLDLRLYEFASNRFKKQAEQHDAAIQYLLPRFKELNMHYQESASNNHEVETGVSKLARRIEAGLSRLSN